MTQDPTPAFKHPDDRAHIVAQVAQHLDTWSTEDGHWALFRSEYRISLREREGYSLYCDRTAEIALHFWADLTHGRRV
jgi:hypothetical protein